MIRTKLRAKSAKRVAQDRAYKPIHDAAMERDGFRCQAPPDVPHGGSLVVHHIVPVGRDGTLRNDIDNLVLICATAHAWVHDHPFLATRLGLLKSSHPAPLEPQ